MNQIHPIAPNPIALSVAPVFARIALEHRSVLLGVRDLIFEVAKTDPRIGAIDEVLRWGEPAYITRKAKTGSTIRLCVEKKTGGPAIFFNCQTTLVEEFRQKFGDTVRYSKNRAVLVERLDVEMSNVLRHCVGAALTYHLREA